MSSAAIVCNGLFPRREYPLYLLGSADLVICCDGALSALEKRGIVPDVLIGDMDSVSKGALSRFGGKIVKVADQQTNDLSKAFSYLMDNMPKDLDSVHILAATGRREDHAMGNLSLLCDFRQDPKVIERGISIDMVSDWTTVIPIIESCTLLVGEGRSVSLISTDPTLRISSKGLQWPTDGVELDKWWKATLNKASSDSITLTLSHPAPVLVILG